MSPQIRNIIIITLILGYVLTSLVVVKNISAITHDEIVGTWREVSWRYEKANFRKSVRAYESNVLDSEKYSMSQNKLIHQSEIWRIKPEKQMRIIKKNKEFEDLTWKLKGRGNILHISHGDSIQEFYQIQSITPNRMILFFENDVHTRDIIRLEFRRIK